MPVLIYVIKDAFGHLVHDGCFETPDRLNLRNSHLAEGRVIPHDMDDVWRGSMFLLQLGQLLAYCLVLCRPFFPMLGFQDVVLGVMNDSR